MSSGSPNTNKRVRLSPHDRRMQLLDCAGRIVLDQGLSKFTIDALAKEAQVSMPLIYKYFDARVEILQALLARASDQFNAVLKDRVEHASSYEELVRMFVTYNFEGARTSNLLTVLSSQPDVRRGVDRNQFDWVRQVLVEETMHQFGLTRKVARQAVLMASAASMNAAQQFSQRKGETEQAIDNTVKFIFGAFRALGAEA